MLLNRILTGIKSFVAWLGRQPVLEPIKELLHYQRTMVLVVGLFSFKFLPTLVSDLPLWLQFIVAVFLVALFGGLFFGLQKEVLVEAQAQVESLPASNEAYFKEFADLFVKALAANNTKTTITSQVRTEATPSAAVPGS